MNDQTIINLASQAGLFHMLSADNLRAFAALTREQEAPAASEPVNAAPAGEPTYEQIDELLQDHAKGSREMHDFAREVLALYTAPAASLPALDSDGDPMKLCTVCGSPVRYGSRHSQCGAALEQAIRAAQPAAQEPSDAKAYADKHGMAVTNDWMRGFDFAVNLAAQPAAQEPKS